MNMFLHMRLVHDKNILMDNECPSLAPTRFIAMTELYKILVVLCTDNITAFLCRRRRRRRRRDDNGATQEATCRSKTKLVERNQKTVDWKRHCDSTCCDFERISFSQTSWQ
jgi:hypothetical protein